MAALGAAVLLAVQLAANYWSYTYLAWVFPLLAVALLIGLALGRLGLRHLSASRPGGAPGEVRLALLHERRPRLAEVVGRDQDLLEGDLLLQRCRERRLRDAVRARASRSPPPAARPPAARPPAPASPPPAPPRARCGSPRRSGGTRPRRSCGRSSAAPSRCRAPRPPAAGSSRRRRGSGPSFVSGRPNFTSSAITRRSQASAISAPRPRQAPWIWATTGFGHLLEQVHHLDAVAPERAQVLRAGQASQLEYVDAGAERGAFAAHHHALDARRRRRASRAASRSASTRSRLNALRFSGRSRIRCRTRPSSSIAHEFAHRLGLPAYSGIDSHLAGRLHGHQEGWRCRLRTDGARHRAGVGAVRIRRRGPRGEPGEARLGPREDQEAARPRGGEGPDGAVRGRRGAGPYPGDRSTTTTSPSATSCRGDHRGPRREARDVAELDPIVKQEALFATNTSSLPRDRPGRGRPSGPSTSSACTSSTRCR